jgi:hypothetical protein
MKRLLLLAFVAALAALSLTSTAAAQDEARIRVLHASPDAPAVDVFLNGDKAVSDLAFDDITDYVAVPAGDYNVRVFPAPSDGTDTPVIDADVTLSAATDYTVAAVGLLENIEPLVLVDDNTAPAAGEARLRFVHASPDAPAVDIFAEGIGVVVPNAAFRDASDYLNVPASTYNIQVRAAGTETVALDLPGVTLEEATVYTAFAVGLLEGEPALSAKLTVDAVSPAVEDLPPTGGAPLSESFSGAVWLVAVGAALIGLAALAGASGLIFPGARRR